MPKKNTTTKVRRIGVLDQIRQTARNPLALLVGAPLGAFVPAATFVVAHRELAHDVPLWLQPAVLLVIGGLLYSAKTVWQWGAEAFSCPWKATGFVALLEGIMVTSGVLELAYGAVALLMAINATATASRLADNDARRQRRRNTKVKPARKPRARLAVVA